MILATFPMRYPPVKPAMCAPKLWPMMWRLSLTARGSSWHWSIMRTILAADCATDGVKSDTNEYAHSDPDA